MISNTRDSRALKGAADRYKRQYIQANYGTVQNYMREMFRPDHRTGETTEMSNSMSYLDESISYPRECLYNPKYFINTPSETYWNLFPLKYPASYLEYMSKIGRFEELGKKALEMCWENTAYSAEIRNPYLARMRFSEELFRGNFAYYDQRIEDLCSLLDGAIDPDFPEFEELQKLLDDIYEMDDPLQEIIGDLSITEYDVLPELFWMENFGKSVGEEEFEVRKCIYYITQSKTEEPSENFTLW